MLAGLWPLQTGEVTTPAKHKLFYLSQRPYLVRAVAAGLSAQAHPLFIPRRIFI